MYGDVRAGNVTPTVRHALALIAFAAASFGSAVHAGPVITGTLVEDHPLIEGPPGRLTIKPTDSEGANGFRISVKLGPYKNTTTGEKVVIGSNRRFVLDLFARDVSSPGCASYASPLTPAGTETVVKLAHDIVEYQVPPLPGDPWPEYSAGTPVQICGEAFLDFGPRISLGVVVGKDAD